MHDDDTKTGLLKAVLLNVGLLDEKAFERYRDAFQRTQAAGGGTTLLRFLVEEQALSEADAAAVWDQLVCRGACPNLGEYELLEKIGEGGMGAVYKARHPRLNTIVALKLLSPQLARDKERLARFEREAHVAAQMGDSNVVRVLDVHKQGPQPFIVMEYVDGNTLEDRIQAGPMDEKASLVILRDVAATLHALHQHGVVHRDVKPSNILVTESGRVKLADLGVAKELAAQDTSLTMAGAGLGTPTYAAPEQFIDAKTVDHRADIYALGGTLYTMLTGRKPYPATTPYTLMMSHVQEPLTDPSELRPGLSKPTVALICAMMAKDPDKRIQTAEEVSRKADEIAGTLVAHSDLATLPSTAALSVQRRRRWAVAACVLAGSVVLLAVAAVVVLNRTDLTPGETGPGRNDTAMSRPARVSSPHEKDQGRAVPGETRMRSDASAASGTTHDAVPAREYIAPVAVQAGPPPLFNAPPLPEEISVKAHQAALTDIHGLAAHGPHIWCAGTGGAARYDAERRTWTYFDERHGLPLPNLQDTVVDGGGQAWFAGSLNCAAVARFNGEGWRAWQAPEVIFLYAKLCTRADGSVFVFDRVRHYSYDGDAFSLHLYEGLGSPVSASTTPGGALLCAHENGLHILHKNREQKRIAYPASWGRNPTPLSVLSAGEDRFWITVNDSRPHDGVWLCTNGSFERAPVSGADPTTACGPLVPHPTDEPFLVGVDHLFQWHEGAFRRIAPTKKSLAPVRNLSAVCGSDGNLYVAARTSSGGLHVFDGRRWREVLQPMDIPGRVNAVRVTQGGTVYAGTSRGLLVYAPPRWRPVDMPGGPRAIHNLTLAPDGTLTMMVGDSGMGATAMVYQDGAWAEPPPPRSTIRTTAMHTLAVDNRGRVVVCHKALARLGGNQWQYWTPEEGLLGTNASPAIDPITGDVWLVARYAFKGLNRLRGDQLDVVTVEGVPTTFSPHSLAIDGKGRKYVGGIIKDDTTRAAVVVIEGERVVRTLDIMPSSSTRKQYPLVLSFGPAGRLWVGMNSGGLGCFDGRRWRFITPADGLLSTHVYDFDFAPDGSIWVATPNGVSHIRLD